MDSSLLSRTTLENLTQLTSLSVCTYFPPTKESFLVTDSVPKFSLQKLTNLIELSLFGNNVSDEGIMHLSNLRSLSIDRCTAFGLHLSKFTNLSSLHISLPSNGAPLLNINDVLNKMTSLTSLTISDFDNNLFLSNSGIRNLTNLRRLHFLIIDILIIVVLLIYLF